MRWKSSSRWVSRTSAARAWDGNLADSARIVARAAGSEFHLGGTKTRSSVHSASHRVSPLVDYAPRARVSFPGGGPDASMNSPAEQPWPSPRRAWYTLAVLTVGLMIATIDRSILSLLVGPIKHDLAVTDTQM